MVVRIRLACLVLTAVCLRAEVHTMTLKEAVEAAMRQNPDLVLARLDEQKARLGVKIARDPFSPRVFAGSGIGKTWGIPQSIDGATPSIVQVKSNMAIYNRPQSLRATQAKEDERGAQIEVGRQQDEVSYRAAAIYLDAEQSLRTVELQRNQIESLEKVRDTVKARVQAGRELPIEEKRAELSVVKARHRLTELEADQETLEEGLATALGLGPEDRVRPSREERDVIAVPLTEDESVSRALEGSKEIRLLESKMQSKALEAKSYSAERLPRIDFAGSYAVLAKFNNYEAFFNKFQRNNGQLGLSISMPVLSGPAARAYQQQADTEVVKLRTQINQVRRKVSQEIREAFHALRKTESAREVAKLDLEVAREQVTVTMARYQEGRAALREMEEARMLESEKWMVFYAARAAVERAHLTLLRHTGTLAAALK